MSIPNARLSAVLAALPTITPAAPPGSDKVLTVVGYAFWAIGLGFLVAAAMGLLTLAWARWHSGRSFVAGSHLGVIAVCAAAFSVIGQIMTPLVG